MYILPEYSRELPEIPVCPLTVFFLLFFYFYIYFSFFLSPLFLILHPVIGLHEIKRDKG
jgi:hypothetical protein